MSPTERVDAARSSIAQVREILEAAERNGAGVDRPEGSRWIQISDTLAVGMAAMLHSAEELLAQ